MVLALALGLAWPVAAGAQAGQDAGAAAPAAVEGRRNAIRIMEAVLSRAVLTGAERLAAQLGSGDPSMSFFTGQARARGFVLDDYGVFFHVEIPEMLRSQLLSVATLQRDVAIASALESLRRAAEAVPEGPERLQAEQAFKRIHLLVGPLPPAGAATRAAAPRGTVNSASVALAEPAESVQTLIMNDPTAAYRDAIKSALIDAMLEHSRGMGIKPDEWLSVAAHRGESPLSPNEIVNSPTLVLRIKGSDLARYDADRARREEIRARVEVREF